MKKYNKFVNRTMCILLCALVIMSVGITSIGTVGAESADVAPVNEDDTPFVIDGVIYRFNGDGESLYVAGYYEDVTRENVVINKEVEGYPVTYISDHAFFAKPSLVSIYIPNTITDMGQSVFASSRGIKIVEFEQGSKLESIGLMAFANCYALQRITIPKRVKVIDTYAFENCKSLTSVNFESGSALTTISARAFQGCYNLSEVSLQDGLEKIAEYAFFNCTSLREIYISDTVTLIDIYALGCFEYEGDIYSNPEFVVVGSPDSLADEYAEAYMVTWEYGLSAPKLSSISNTTDGVKLTFEKLSGVSGQYRIYRKTSETSWKTLANITSNTYTDKTAESGVYYTYTVKFIGYDGTESRYDKNGLSITRLVTPTVTNIANTNDGVKLTISEVKGAAYYRVYYKTSDGWKGIDNTDTTTFVHDNAQSGETYTYTVKAFDENGASSSFVSKGFTNQFIETPVITAVSSTKNGVQISWNKVTGAGIYRVYVKTDTGWKGLGNTTSTTFTDTSATSRGRYTYTVRCMAQDGKTAVSGYDKEGKSCTVFSRAPEKEMIDSINKIQRHDGADKYPSSVKPQLNKQQKSIVSIQSLSEKLRLLLNNK